MMDKPEQRCESSETYSFTSCVKNSFSRKIGCRLKWDVWSSEDIPFCTKVDQLLQFEHEYANVTEVWERSDYFKHTGCHFPCHYTEYKFGSDPLRIRNGFQNMSVNFMLSSLDILSRAEERIYTFSSFLAELGGALGLFLGFSFIMIWDTMKSVICKLLKWFKGSKYVNETSPLEIKLNQLNIRLEQM